RRRQEDAGRQERRSDHGGLAMADEKKKKGKGQKDAKPQAKTGGKDAKAPPQPAAKDGKRGKGKTTEAAKQVAREAETTRDPNYVPRLKLRYKQSIAAALTKQFSYKNSMMVPRLQKVVINMGLGSAVANPKHIDTAVEDLRAISGQKPVVTR